MSNTGGAAGSEGSPSNPNPPRTEESPRPRSGGANIGSPRGRGTPPRPTRPSPPGSSRGTSGGSSGLSSDGGGLAVPVGGGSPGGAAALRNVASPVGRKRMRFEGIPANGGGGEDGGRRIFPCSVCSRVFDSPHAVFGHMRAHPDRGWTGAHPPPSFRAEEEFADLRIADAAAAGGGEATAAAAAGGGEVAAEEAAGETRAYRVPDLNNPPPPESI